MDTFIHILGLSNILKSFPRKLDFFSKTGLLSSRSLEKLNRIRNKMEHEYADPNLAEIDAYFDLASGFIHSLEGYIFMLGSHKEQEWERKDIPDKVALRIKLNQTPPQITFQIAGGRTITFDAKHFDTYLQGLEIYFLICRATALLSADYVIYKLNRNKSPNTGGRYSR
ncbi:hypothetical protein SAMN05192549_12029 [Duganella sacchari]|uniref:Uncharacterized protein n=2 Tax=Duganella sacchari TaxID=551987 RepID=A0A1M7RD59_9BURK|nr:hypothetical protein SAMN05192549_12029 [Duganella sacchari]